MAPNDIAFDVLGLPTETEESTDETRPEGAFEVTTILDGFIDLPPSVRARIELLRERAQRGTGCVVVDPVDAGDAVPGLAAVFDEVAAHHAASIRGSIAKYRRSVARLNSSTSTM